MSVRLLVLMNLAGLACAGHSVQIKLGPPRMAQPLSLVVVVLLPLLAHSRTCTVLPQPNATVAIQTAINECAGDPGAPGTVVVQGPGTFGINSLNLRSHLTLIIQQGAVLQGPGSDANLPSWPPLPSYPDCRGSCARPIIVGINISSVSITGGGVINGGFPNGGGGPKLVQFRNSSGIRLSNVTLTKSAFWTLHFWACSDVSVVGCTIQNPPRAITTDGIDIDSTQDAYIAHNYIEVGDDGVALKSGMDGSGRAFARPTQNVSIVHNFFNFSGGVAIGSEMSGDVRDVYVAHNILRGDAHNEPSMWTWGPRVLTIKSQRGRGGVVENVLVYNTSCIDCDQVARISMQSDTPLLDTTQTPVVRNVTIQLVRGTCEEPGFFQDLPESPIGMSFVDVVVTPLRDPEAQYTSCSAFSPYGIGRANQPAVCNLSTFPKFLPTVYGGPSAGTSSFDDQAEGFGATSGSLFGYSGIDGSSDTPSRFVGWFVNGSYSVYLWLPTPRILSLGFGEHRTSGPSDQVDMQHHLATHAVMPQGPAQYQEADLAQPVSTSGSGGFVVVGPEVHTTAGHTADQKSGIHTDDRPWKKAIKRIKHESSAWVAVWGHVDRFGNTLDLFMPMGDMFLNKRWWGVGTYMSAEGFMAALILSPFTLAVHAVLMLVFLFSDFGSTRATIENLIKPFKPSGSAVMRRKKKSRGIWKASNDGSFQCGSGGIRDYNFCAGLALLWLRGGE